MQNPFIPVLVRSIHNIFTSIWIGGMAAILLSFYPAIRKTIEDKALQGKLMENLVSYQSKWAYAGIVLLTATGILMSRLSGKISKPFDFSNPYAMVLSIKHILVILAALIAIFRSIAFKQAPEGNDQKKKKMSFMLLALNTTIGFVILVLSSINALLG
jgi:uncharacterized membrane protein